MADMTVRIRHDEVLISQVRESLVEFRLRRLRQEVRVG
jgi:hypothetical protein